MPSALPYNCLHIYNFPTKLSSLSIELYSKNQNPTPLAKPKPTNSAIEFRKINRESTNFLKREYISLTRVIRSYLDSGSLDDALQLFEKMRYRDTFLWNVVVRGVVDHGFYEKAVDFYYRMLSEGVKPDYFTYPFVIKACTELSLLIEGEKIHAKAVKAGIDIDIYVCNTLIALYAKLNCVDAAERVFEEKEFRDLVSWNSIISGYVSAGDGWSSLLYFRNMQRHGMMPDRFSMVSALCACSLECFLPNGREIHCAIIRRGFENVMLQTAVVDMYGKCGRVDLARRHFDSMPQRSIGAWNSMIGGYALNDCPMESFACLRKMIEADRLLPDTITLINVLPACVQLRALVHGKSVHALVIRKGLLPHFVLETSLIDLYGTCKKLRLAEIVFGAMIEKNLVSLNSMLSAYVQNERYKEALELFRELLETNIKPDAVTVSSVLPAYAELASLREGKQVHGCVTKLGFGTNSYISNALIYMYAKCGDLTSSRKYFDGIVLKDIVTWNTVIMAHALHGFGEESMKLFSKMRQSGIEPNASTFVSLLSSLSIAGMVDEGWDYFNLMKREYGIDPGIEHYGCMFDLLGRRGNLVLAEQFIKEMPLIPTARIWGSLLTASRNNNNIELAERASSHILSLQHDNTGCYVLLYNMYAEAGRWKDVKRIKALMDKEGIRKTAGFSIIELNGKVYRFRNKETCHTEMHKVYDALDLILKKTREESYDYSLTKFTPADLDKQKANSPDFHSVRLAITFGLISTTIGRSILVKKNVRICDHCHNAVKKISEITQREIIVGDSKIFHCFKNGRCSCEDYW